MSPPLPGIPSGIVAMSLRVFASTRDTVPSPWLRVQIEPPPEVRNRGLGPTVNDERTSPDEASTAVKPLMSTPVIQITPSLKSGLYEPGGIAMRWRTALVSGLMRVSVPFSSEMIQMLSLLAVIPASAPAVPNGRMELMLFVFTSIRASVGVLPHTGTQMLPNPNANPEHASPVSRIFAMTLLLVGSMRCTESGFDPPTQTASSVTRTQSAVLPILNVADGFKE